MLIRQADNKEKGLFEVIDHGLALIFEKIVYEHH
jgi:hypothetical protein